MTQTLTDTLGNTITFNYDGTNDSITITNSALGSQVMNVVKNTSDDVIELDVIMLAEYLEYDTWSDMDVRNQLKSFWDTNKVNK